MLSEIASRYLSQNRPLSAFSPYAPASDRTAWEGLDEEWRQKSLAKILRFFLALSLRYRFHGFFPHREPGAV